MWTGLDWLTNELISSRTSKVTAGLDWNPCWLDFELPFVCYSSLAGPQECWLLTANRLQVVTAQVKVCLNLQCLALHSFTDIYTGRKNVSIPTYRKAFSLSQCIQLELFFTCTILLQVNLYFWEKARMNALRKTVPCFTVWVVNVVFCKTTPEMSQKHLCRELFLSVDWWGLSGSQCGPPAMQCGAEEMDWLLFLVAF